MLVVLTVLMLLQAWTGDISWRHSEELCWPLSSRTMPTSWLNGQQQPLCPALKSSSWVTSAECTRGTHGIMSSWAHRLVDCRLPLYTYTYGYVGWHVFCCDAVKHGIFSCAALYHGGFFCAAGEHGVLVSDCSQTAAEQALTLQSERVCQHRLNGCTDKSCLTC